MNMEEVWRDHSKHVFILTAAGKPVFSRYGTDLEQTSITSVITAVVGRTLDTADPLKCVVRARARAHNKSTSGLCARVV